MSSQIQCRQCGKFLSRSDFPAGQFKCPDCNWTQMLSSARPRGTKKKQQSEKPSPDPATAESAPATARAGKPARAGQPASGAPKAPAAPTPPAAVQAAPAPKPAAPKEPPPRTLAPLPVLDLDGLRALTPADFRLWCCALLARFGYAETGAPRDGHLEFERVGERILVDCVAFGDRENVGRPECQGLLDAMEQRRIIRGLLLSPGSFENGCRALAQRGGAGRVQLVDGARLELTAREIANGPLAAWWS